MKAFHFRLDQALRWRATQRDLEKSRVSVAAKRLQDLREEIDRRREEITAGARQLPSSGATGALFAAWNGFTEQSRRRIRSLETSAAAAEQDLAIRLQALTEANRRVQLLENLRQTAHGNWKAEFNRELETAAGEFFLFRLQSRDRMGA